MNLNSDSKTDVDNMNDNGKTKSVSGILTLFATIFIYFSSQFFTIIIFSIYFQILGKNTKEFELITGSVLGQFSLVFCIDLFILAQLKFILTWSKQKFIEIGWLPPKLSDLGYAITGFFVYFPIFFGFVTFIEKNVPQIDIDQTQQIGFDTANTTGELAIVFISLVILAPIFEELLFRGYLYTNLKLSIGILKAAIVTSIIFGVAHLQLGGSAPPLWIAAIDTGILSIILIVLREKSKGLMASIGLHMIKNSIAYVALFIVR